MKVCSKCKVEKELSEFHKQRNSKDGYKSLCKSCVLSKEKERRDSPEFKERYKEYLNSIPQDIKSKRRKKY